MEPVAASVQAEETSEEPNAHLLKQQISDRSKCGLHS